MSLEEVVAEALRSYDAQIPRHSRRYDHAANVVLNRLRAAEEWADEHDLRVWGSECLDCGNATQGTSKCSECGSNEFTVPLFIRREEEQRIAALTDGAGTVINPEWKRDIYAQPPPDWALCGVCKQRGNVHGMVTAYVPGELCVPCFCVPCWSTLTTRATS